VAVVARKLRVPVTVYGPVLEARVRGFQALRGLPTDGVVDLTVAKELGDVHLFVPEWYSEELSEDSLRTAQMLLGIPANGVDDAITENAVRRFQSGRGIPVTGVIDIDTAKWMGEL
jgi:peptidoglycan hydrolase-like protein with peptidoglycan-binding domain